MRFFWTAIFCIWICVAQAGEAMRLGPAGFSLTLDGVRFHPEIMADASLQSTRSGVAVEGVLRIGGKAAQLESDLLRWGRMALPSLANGFCVLDMPSVSLAVVEAQLKVTVVMVVTSAQCPQPGAFVFIKPQVTVSLLLASDSKVGGQWRLRLAAPAQIVLPKWLDVFVGGRARKALHENVRALLAGPYVCAMFANVQKSAPACAHIMRQTGVTAAFKGVNFSTEKDRIWMNVKMDGRIEAAAVMPVVEAFLEDRDLRFEFLTVRQMRTASSFETRRDAALPGMRPRCRLVLQSNLHAAIGNRSPEEPRSGVSKHEGRRLKSYCFSMNASK